MSSFQIREGGGNKKIVNPPARIKTNCVPPVVNLAAASSRRWSRLSIIDTLSMPVALHASMIFIVGISLYGWWNFFFFFFVRSRLARGCLLLYFILFGMLGGDWKGIEFLVGAFFETWNYSACYFFFLFFSKIHFFYPYIALDILIKSIIVELILCLNIYVIKFFFSFVFFFSFLSVYAIY